MCDRIGRQEAEQSTDTFTLWACDPMGRPQTEFYASCAATESFRVDGCIDAALNTDAHRLAALKTYLRIGYRPEPRHEAHAEIWARALDEIGFEPPEN